MPGNYLEPTKQAIAKFLARQPEGEFVLLHLLRFRTRADYSEHPKLAPKKKISGRSAYAIYLKHLTAYLNKQGDSILFIGDGGHFIIGPKEERWDQVMMVRHKSLDSFNRIAADQEFQLGLGHRTAALEDCRLLPVDELASSNTISG